ncbi:MAG: hypothetical protein R3F11_03805 [Verrucomicrobiales bacterium]
MLVGAELRGKFRDRLVEDTKEENERRLNPETTLASAGLAR